MNALAGPSALPLSWDTKQYDIAGGTPTAGKTCTTGTTAMQDEREDQRPTETMADRLAKVRGQMTDEEFAKLVADIGRTAERFAEIDAAPDANLPAAPNEPDGT
jgi:hypothetical protein